MLAELFCIGAQPSLTVKANHGVSGGFLARKTHFAPLGLVGAVPNLDTWFDARHMNHAAGRYM